MKSKAREVLITDKGTIIKGVFAGCPYTARIDDKKITYDIEVPPSKGYRNIAVDIWKWEVPKSWGGENDDSNMEGRSRQH